MKILIAYYSRRGKTEKVAKAIKEEMEARGHSVDVEKIKPLQEHSWRTWFFLRFFIRETPIQELRIKNVSKYNIVCLGSSNWSSVAAPVSRYLKEIKGLQYKKVGIFSTTTLWPQLEKYFFSAFLFDFTFTKVVNKQKGRVINSVLLSGFLKGCSVESNYGEKALKAFVDKLEDPILSLKDYFLEQRELERTRILLILFSVFLFISLAYQCLATIFGNQILTWQEYFYLFVIGLFAYLSIFLMVVGKRGFVWAKYVVGLTLVSGLTITTLFLAPSFSRLIVLGYVLVFVFLTFLYDSRAVMFTGIIAVLSYIFLSGNFPVEGVLFSGPDIFSIFLSFTVTSFISKDLKDNFISLLEAQDEMETAKAVLEIKVAARTKELKDFSKRLEDQVEDRTRELQLQIKELEKFNSLAVGRELKMVALKEEMVKLKQESKENKGRSVKIIKKKN